MGDFRTYRSLYSVLFLGLIAVAFGGCNRPKQTETASQESQKTRTQAVVTREKAASGQAAPATREATQLQSQRGESKPLGSPPDSCTLSLVGQGWVADCVFQVCPKELLAGLVLSDSVVLAGTGPTWDLVARRELPPQAPLAGVQLRKTEAGWGITGLSTADPAPCTLAGDALSASPERLELPVGSLAVRSHLKTPNTSQ